MIKIRGALMKFGVNDTLGIRFSKDCVIDISNYTPITYLDRITTVGHVVSWEEDNSEIRFEGVIDNPSKPGFEDALRQLVEKQELYSGGYYKINKDHYENGIRVLDDIRLMSIGLYRNDIYGDKSTVLEIVNEKEE